MLIFCHDRNSASVENRSLYSSSPVQRLVPSLRFSTPFQKTETPFFRDSISLVALKRVIRGQLLEALHPGKPLLVWVPQCSTGQDAYSVAICLIEALGNHWREIPLCVFSTDSDEDSVSRARAGRYSIDACRGLSAKTIERFFVKDSNRISIRPFVRDVCRFAKHDLVHAPPFSRLDMIACRKILETVHLPERRGVLQFFHSILAPGGILLDETGSAANESKLFKPIGKNGCYVAQKIQAKPHHHIPVVASQLWESEERFRVLFSQMEDAILVQDIETDLILKANESAQRLYGWSLPEFLKLHGKDLLVSPKAVRRPKAERRSEDRLCLPHYRRKNGTLFPADIKTAFLMFQGRPCNLWMVKDATPRLRLNSGRAREEEKDAFVGDVVHELRSPIAVIRSSVETLRRRACGTRDRSTFLGFIENHSDRMANLVDRLLDFSAADSLKRNVKPSRVLLSEAMWKIAGAFISVAKRRKISLTIDIPTDLAVIADPAHLPHIFGNLLDNAIKFSPQGGKVSISGYTKGKDGVLSFRDSGKGIAPEDLNRIFKRFFRSERTRKTKGTGLGLAIVKEIVKANHGLVRAENDASGGAAFHVSFPLAPHKRDGSNL